MKRLMTGPRKKRGESASDLNAPAGAPQQHTMREGRLANAELRAVFHIVPDLHFRLAADGTILNCYTGSRSDLLVPPDALVGKPVGEVLPSEVAGAIRDAIAETLRTDSLVCIEYELMMPAGNEHYEARFVPFAAAEVVAIVRNVTQQKRTEEALRESERRFGGAFEHAPIGMGLVAIDGRPLRVNRALCQMFGYSEEALLAMPVWQVTHPDDMPATIDWLRRMLEGEVDSWQLEKRFIHRLGHTVWGLSATSLVRGSDGRPLYVISQVQDITEHKQAQEQITHLASFPEDNPNPVIEIGRHGVPTYLNPAAQRHFPDAPGGDLPSAILAGLEAPIAARDDGNHNVIVREITCARRVYEEHVVIRPDRLRVYLQDVTERVSAEAEVRHGRERLQVLSRRLIAVQESERQHLARELHDEIAQILTGLRLALEGTAQLPAENARRRLADAQALVSDLVERVRDLSLDLRPAMLDDLGLLPALLWLCKWYFTRTAVRVQFRHRGLDRRFTPEIETAAFRIVQEALTNASRYAGVSEVTVQAWADEARLGVQVVDAGVGFNPAAAATGATSGLAGMRERASLLGGQLTIESTVGNGTRVMAEFPLADLQGQPIAP